jgi:N-acetylneuraminic acid mutarotase
MTTHNLPGRAARPYRAAVAAPLLALALAACTAPRSGINQPTGPAVDSLTLLDAASGQPIGGFDPIVDGSTLDLGSLPTKRFNLRANTTGAAVVRFSLNGESDYGTADGAAPMLVAPGGTAWTPTKGQHTIGATAFGDAAMNNPGPAFTVSFTVTSAGSDWQTKTPAPYSFYESQGAMLDGKLYVISGFETGTYATSKVYSYDLAADKWERRADFPDGFDATHDGITHAATAADEATNTIWMAGGFLGDHPGPSTDHVWKFDVAKNQWSPGPPLPEPLGGGALVRLGRTVHYVGGVLRVRNPDGSATYVRDSGKHWTLNLDNPTAWRPAADLPNPRNHMAGAALGGKIYAIGGQHLDKEGNQNQSSVEVYDPATDSWSAAASLPKPLSHVSDATFVRQGRIVVVAGVTNHAHGDDEDGLEQSAIYQYDPASNAWSDIGQIPGPRQSPIAGTSDKDGRIIVVGGWDGYDSYPENQVWVGTP